MPSIELKQITKSNLDLNELSQNLSYDGQVAPKLLVFRNKERAFFISRIISVEESDAWKACEEMLSYSAKMASSQITGFYGLELISLNLHGGIQNFVSSACTQLIINHAKKMKPGDKSIFQYGSFLLALHKRIDNDWGKIDFKTYVEVFRKPRSQLDLLIKKKCREILKNGSASRQTKSLIIVDLSEDSLFRFGEEEQTERLAGFINKSRKEFESQYLRVFFENDVHGSIDLFEQFQR